MSTSRLRRVKPDQPSSVEKPAPSDAAVPAEVVRLSSAQRARRETILKVAIELLAKRDYEQIQVREIAEAAGVALATLYRYFPSKEQLYAHAFVAWGEPFGALVRTKRGQAQTDEARLQAAVRSSLRAYEKNPRLYRLITSLEVGADKVAADLMRGFGERYRQILAGVMQDTDEEDAQRMALMVVGALDVLMRKWGCGDISLRQFMEEIEKTVALMFRQPRAREAGSGAPRLAGRPR
jgi:AcrR family transcriptional regulator